MGHHEEPEKIWDEYDWERFLRQQDRKTEKYMELLEKYIDNPDRDQIIAREMGWHHLLDEEGTDWAASVEASFSEEMESLSDKNVHDWWNNPDGFEMHPLYKASFALTVWIDKLFNEMGDIQSHPSAVKLATLSAIASAKLAAALSDDAADEIGMTIAYLKRALQAITAAMETAAHLKKEVRMDEARYATLRQRLFQIRDGVIALMGEYRSEWRRRFGSA